MNFRTRIFVLATAVLLGMVIAGGGAYAARYASLDVDELLVLGTAKVNMLEVGGDPATNTAGVALTAPAAPVLRHRRRAGHRR